MHLSLYLPLSKMLDRHRMLSVTIRSGALIALIATSVMALGTDAGLVRFNGRRFISIEFRSPPRSPCIPPVAQEIEREPQQACVSRNTKTWRCDVDHSEE
jgi:hypothetical protein